MKLKVTVNGVAYDIDVEVEEQETPSLGAIVIGGSSHGPVAPTTASVQASSANAVVAPLAGTVARVLVEEGQEIEAGEVLCVLEAMKMETEITATSAGTVAGIPVSVGDAVTGGQVLVRIGPAE